MFISFGSSVVHVRLSLFQGRDLHFEPDQATIHVPYVKELLESATGTDADGNKVLTIADLSRILSKRRAESRAENPKFSLDRAHKRFGSAKYVLFFVISRH